jgi:hypothetical protein
MENTDARLKQNVADMPRMMIVVWHWDFTNDQDIACWNLNISKASNMGDKFVQSNIPAEDGIDRLSELLREKTPSYNVLLFLHNHQNLGYNSDSRLKILENIGPENSRNVVIRLFTGGREPIYRTRHFPYGLLGSGGTLGNHLDGHPESTVETHDENGKKAINYLHFDAVWDYYWLNVREKIYDLKERYRRWALVYDTKLISNSSYLAYLKQDQRLWAALSSFAKGGKPDIQDYSTGFAFWEKQIDFSDCKSHIEKAYADVDAGEGKKVPDLYEEVKEQIRKSIFVKPIKNEDADKTTNYVYNLLSSLWRAIPHDTY